MTSTELPKQNEDAGFDARKKRAAKLKDQEHRNTLYLVLTDMLFVLLPFIVTGIVLSFKGKFYDFIIQPEWTLAASVISGQAIVKCIAGYLSAGESAWQKITLGITAAIVLSFTPSLLVFTLIVNSDQAQTSLPLLELQIIIFFVGLIVFAICGWLVEDLRSDARYQRNTAPRREVNAPAASKLAASESESAVGSARFPNLKPGNNSSKSRCPLNLGSNTSRSRWRRGWDGSAQNHCCRSRPATGDNTSSRSACTALQ